jgi:hypothetical protein
LALCRPASDRKIARTAALRDFSLAYVARTLKIVYNTISVADMSHFAFMPRAEARETDEKLPMSARPGDVLPFEEPGRYKEEKFRLVTGCIRSLWEVGPWRSV